MESMKYRVTKHPERGEFYFTDENGVDRFISDTPIIMDEAELGARGLAHVKAMRFEPITEPTTDTFTVVSISTETELESNPTHIVTAALPGKTVEKTVEISKQIIEAPVKDKPKPKAKRRSRK
jgi:hypothetical protein